MGQSNMKTTLKPLKPVLVEWSDILDGGAEWHQHDGKHLKPVRVRTVGYLMHVNRKHIVIVRDYYDSDGKRTLGGRLAIPCGCIEKIVYLAATDEKPAIS
jgi:hypothetical protein